MKKFQKIISLTAILALSSAMAVPYASADKVGNQEVINLDSGAVTQTGWNLYVDTAGSDTDGNGTKEKPYATLERARDAIRSLKGDLPDYGVTVWVKGGEYEFSNLQFTDEDSGTPDKPIIYRTYAGEQVTLTNGIRINASDWKPLSAAAKARVHPDVDANALYQLDVKSLGLKHIKHFEGGTSFTEKWGIIDLISNGIRQPISQWPNITESVDGHRKGWTTANGSADAKSFYYGEGGIPENGDTTDTLDLDGSNRAARWQKSLSEGHALYLKGFWRTVWSPLTSSVQSIDTKHNVITLKDIPDGGMGSKWSATVSDYASATSATANTYGDDAKSASVAPSSSATSAPAADDALHDTESTPQSYKLFNEQGESGSVSLKENVTDDSQLTTEATDSENSLSLPSGVTEHTGTDATVTEHTADSESANISSSVKKDVYQTATASTYLTPSSYSSKIKAPYRIGSGSEEWKLINYLDEIDVPGEWSLDFKDGQIYYYPKGNLKSQTIIIADQENPVVSLDGASNLKMLGFTVEGGMGNGIELKNTDHITIAGNTLRNLGNGGILDVDGTNNLFQSNDIYETGGFGISINDAGDRKTLAAANSRVTNNHIHNVGDLTHLEAILVRNSVGVKFDHNLLHDVPKDAVRYVYSNNLTFEYNEVHNTSLIEGDTGAFYTAQDWASYGNVLQYNFVHHNKRSNGFYSDGADSGDNYRYNIVQGSTKGILLNGHDNIANNNLVVDSNMIQVDQRGDSNSHGVNSIYADQLREMNPTSGVWKEYGATLQKTYGYDHPLWSSILDPNWHPEYPNGTKMNNNVMVNTPNIVIPKLGDVDVEGNQFISTVTGAGFYDYSKMDLRTDNKTILAKFPNLNGVMPKIGLSQDEYRTKVVTRAESGGLTNH